jgi:hypothetical protein
MWQHIPEFEDYAVNEYGEVLNLKFNRPMRPSPNQQGIAIVGLMYQGVQYKRSVARLVADLFMDPAPNPRFDTPIQLDGNRFNCAVDNLMWRPLHFAIKYHQQFYNNRRGFEVPVIETNTRETFATSWEAAVLYGLIDRDILYAYINRTVVFPTGQHFEPIEPWD